MNAMVKTIAALMQLARTLMEHIIAIALQVLQVMAGIVIMLMNVALKLITVLL